MGFLGAFFLRLTAKGGYILYKSQLRGKRRNLSLGLHKRKQKFILGFPYKGEHQANWLGHRQPQTLNLRAKGLCFQCWWKPFSLWTKGNCHISSSGIPRGFPALSCFCGTTNRHTGEGLAQWRHRRHSFYAASLSLLPGTEVEKDSETQVGHSIGTEAWFTICSPSWSDIMTIKTLKD